MKPHEKWELLKFCQTTRKTWFFPFFYFNDVIALFYARNFLFLKTILRNVKWIANFLFAFERNHQTIKMLWWNATFSLEFLCELKKSIDLEIDFFSRVFVLIRKWERKIPNHQKKSKMILENFNASFTFDPAIKKSLMIFLRCQFHCYLATHFKPSTHHHIKHSKQF